MGSSRNAILAEAIDKLLRISTHSVMRQITQLLRLSWISSRPSSLSVSWPVSFCSLCCLFVLCSCSSLLSINGYPSVVHGSSILLLLLYVLRSFPVPVNTFDADDQFGFRPISDSPRVFQRLNAMLVPLYTHAFLLQVCTVELANHSTRRVIRRHVNQSMALNHTRAVGDGQYPGADNSRLCRKRQAKHFFKNPVSKIPQVLSLRRVGNSRNMYYHIFVGLWFRENLRCDGLAMSQIAISPPCSRVNLPVLWRNTWAYLRSRCLETTGCYLETSCKYFFHNRIPQHRHGCE